MIIKNCTVWPEYVSVQLREQDAYLLYEDTALAVELLHVVLSTIDSFSPDWRFILFIHYLELGAELFLLYDVFYTNMN